MVALLALAQTFVLAQSPEGPGITTRLSYSMGTHENHVVRAVGQVELDPDAPNVLAGFFSVPLDALVSDNPERDCHMREALGLDYRRSRYPDDHVCDGGRVTEPIAFPEIRLDLRSAAAPALASLQAGRETPVTVDGSWSIHGVRQLTRLHLTLAPDGEAVRVRGSALIRLEDFGIKVKSAHVLFVSINAGSVALVSFDLKLVRLRRGPS